MSTGLKYSLEDYDTFKRQSGSLLEDNCKEVSPYGFNLDPDWDRYLKVYEIGQAGVYTCRSGGLLVAYLVVFADTHMHYKGKIFATVDALYVAPRFRKTRVAFDLIKYAEDDLANKGVDIFIVTSSNKKPISGGLAHMGYEAVETPHFKRISKNG